MSSLAGPLSPGAGVGVFELPPESNPEVLGLRCPLADAPHPAAKRRELASQAARMGRGDLRRPRAGVEEMVSPAKRGKSSDLRHWLQRRSTEDPSPSTAPLPPMAGDLAAGSGHGRAVLGPPT